MDLLEKLADVSVPPVPAAKTFIAGVRRKLHPRLLAVHIVEFAFGAMSCAVLHLFAALFGPWSTRCGGAGRKQVFETRSIAEKHEKHLLARRQQGRIGWRANR